MDLNEINAAIEREVKKRVAEALRGLADQFAGGTAAQAAPVQIAKPVQEGSDSKKEGGLRLWSQVAESEKKLLKNRWYPCNSVRRRKGLPVLTFPAYLLEKCSVDFER